MGHLLGWLRLGLGFNIVGTHGHARNVNVKGCTNDMVMVTSVDKVKGMCGCYGYPPQGLSNLLWLGFVG